MLEKVYKDKYNKYHQRVEFWLCTLNLAKIGTVFPILYENYKVRKLKNLFATLCVCEFKVRIDYKTLKRGRNIQ